MIHTITRCIYTFQVVKEKYKDENAVRGVFQLVEFDSDAITLDIPIDGVCINGWKITPQMYPMVSFC